MAVFATFIKPSAGAAGFNHWRRRIAFGERLPSRRCSGFVHLEVDDAAEGKLFAAFAGKLSTRQPTGFLQPVTETIADEASNAATLSLYLEPNSVKLDPAWQALCAQIASRFSGIADAALKADSIGYFAYRNVDSQQAKALLCARLKIRKPPRNAAPGCNEELWKRFVAGEGHIAVQSGEEIGAAGQSYLPNTQNNRFQVAIGLRTRFGMFDVGTWYEDINTTLGVHSPSNVGPLASLLLTQLPLIDPIHSVNTVGADRLWPWSALLQYKRNKNLAYSEWRRLGDRQKQLYRDQLLARVRPASAPANTARFEFDVDDMSNVFQLEAVTEFYINLPDPWATSSQPVPPNAATYRKINLLALYGAGAQVSGNDVTLDDQLDMDRIVAGRDTLLLEHDTSRSGKQFRIMGVDPENNKVTLDLPPQVAAASPWRVFHNPTLVIIDAFGSRVRGAGATVGAAPRTLELDSLSDAQLSELARVNPYDTISLTDVAAGGEHEARILETPQIDRTARSATLKIDRSLSPAGTGSSWAIPAGVGAVQGHIEKAKRTASDRWGWDNYDGRMFLVAGGEVKCFFPWTSYTSRASSGPPRHGGTTFHSSIKGNRPYRFGSVFSRNLYINVAFSVIDAEGMLWGNRETPTNVPGVGRVLISPDIQLSTTLVDKYQNIYFVQPQPPRFSVASTTEVDVANNKLRIGKKFADAVPASSAPYWILVYDGVREARFYFKPGFDSDSAPPNTRPPFGTEELGKGGIRIHKGEIGKNGSHGCQVSTYFMRLRMAMIDYHSEANATYYAENQDNPKLDRVREMHSEMHKPPLVQAYQKMTSDLAALQQNLKLALADPLAQALQEVFRASNGDDGRLQALRVAIQDFQAKLLFAQDAADTPSEQEIIPVLETLVDLATDEDVTSAVQWAAENAERVSRLKQELQELEKRIKEETEHWGWNDAMHGEYWIVRPDEREV